jgi:hypothetical protein
VRRFSSPSEREGSIVRRHLGYRIPVLLLGIALILSPVALGQAGSQIGLIRGTVSLSDGTGPLPGVTVTLKSPAMQGQRSTVSSSSGEYIFKALPPGTFTVTFQLSGMKTVAKSVPLALGATSILDAKMEVAAAAAEVTVVATAATEDQVAVHGANYDGEAIATLPITRNLSAIAALAPGLTTRTVNAGQVQISGSFAYDNKFLVDGVDVNDNLFGSATNQLYIEEAVEETQVMTSGISAEYGGFSGGIVNAITKSGSNEYHGSFRVDFSNDSWTKENPYEDSRNITHPSKVNEVYSGTLGGKIIADHLWFFGAGRYLKTDTQQVLPVTAAQWTQNAKQYRWEGKLTGNIAGNHTLQFTYNDSNQDLNRVAFTGSSLQSIELNTVGPAKQPTSIWVASYNGVLTPNLFGTVQYSEKKFKFEGPGGSDTNLVTGSPFFSATTFPTYHFHAPYFDLTDPENRNNKEFNASLSYFLSTSSLGSHDIKGGYNLYESIRTGGNSQSPTSYVFYADFKTDAAGNPVFDTNGNVIPLWNSDSFIANYIASRGAQNNIKTNAVYINDAWKISNHLSASIGFRYEWVKGSSSTGATLTDTSAFVPRIGLAWDPTGDAKYRVSGTYGQYAGKYNDAQFGATSNVGNPNGIYSSYVGPSGEGYGFAPAFDLTHNYEIFRGSFPLANVFFEKGLSSPLTTEWTLSAGARLGNDGNVAVTFVDRKTKGFVEDFITMDNGTTHVVIDGVDYGTYDNIVYRNNDTPRREYQAIELQGRYNVLKNLQTQLNYTYMIKFDGNFEGEASNQPGISSIYGNYPEIQAYERTFPNGRMSGYEQHKIRWITNWDVHLQKLGVLSLGGILSFDSGSVYSLTNSRPYTSIQLAKDPGYANLPATQTIYYGERGSQTFGSRTQFDMSVQWEIPVYQTLSPYVRFYATNLFNSSYHNYNTSVVANTGASAPKDQYGLPTTYTPGANFGKVTASSQYMTPFAWNFSLGLRF